MNKLFRRAGQYFLIVFLGCGVLSLKADEYALPSFQQTTDVPDKIRLSLMGKPLVVEVANTNALRERGLMYREPLSGQEGMLFVFPHVGRHCFWMKNTPNPLTIVFIDQNNRIVDVQDMQALSEEVHCPSGAVRYALELAQGWFTQQKVEVPLLLHAEHPSRLVHFSPTPMPADN